VTPEDVLAMGVQVAFDFFALGLLMAFAWGVLLGFVDFVRRILG
jgi:hypothetical protein